MGKRAQYSKQKTNFLLIFMMVIQFGTGIDILKIFLKVAEVQ